jgi:hypothetical protein
MTASQPPRGGRRRLRRAAALAAALAGAATLAPGAAHAGTYPMYAGDVPGVNLPAPSRGAWGFYSTSGQVSIVDQLGLATKGAYANFNINYPSGVLAQNAGVGMQLSLPPEVSIARVYDWSKTQLTAQGANEPNAIGLNLTATGTDTLIGPPGHDTTGLTGTNTTSGPGHDSGPLPANTKTRKLGVFCAYVGASKGNCTLPNPILTIRGIKTLLTESIQPSAAINGGSLTAGGPLKGSKTVAYTAGDLESGVEKVEVTLDGAVVATQSFARDLTLPVYQQAGDCSYVGVAACPASKSEVLPVDTTTVPDGAYELGVRVTDAAGNSRTTLAPTAVVIDNVPDSAPPKDPGPAPSGAVGPTGSAGPKGAAGPVGAAGANGVVLHVNGINGARGASLRATFSASGRDTIRSPYGRRVLVTGQLVAPSGKPITGARVAVSQQDKLVGARMVPVAEVVTDRDGKFRYVTTATRSRTIRFGYRAQLEDTDFTATKDVGLGVIAKLGLSTSRKTLRNGQTVVFRGSVAGAPANARKVIELQVRKGSQWMTFRSTRLRSGRFAERYRFTRTRGRVTYQFRARLRQEAGFPFLTSHSKTVKVTVRG